MRVHSLKHCCESEALVGRSLGGLTSVGGGGSRILKADAIDRSEESR